MFAIEVKNYSFRYFKKSNPILDEINFQVKEGEAVGIVGLSGNGKSTLCYALCGIIPHIYKGDRKGDVLLFGTSTSHMEMGDISKKVGIVFQDPDTQLFSPTVEDEVAFGPENLCVSREEIGERIQEALEKVGMKMHRNENPNALSGGQKQLVAIASVLSMQPEILIFDESMSQVDIEGKKRIKEVIRALKKDGKTILMVEHDFDNLDVVDRIVVLKNGKLQEFTGNL